MDKNATTPHKTESWNETPGYDRRLLAASDVEIRSITDLETPAATVTQNLYFEGANILQCTAGRFRFSLDGLQMIEIGPGEMLVTYPGHRVTMEALEGANHLVYVILRGTSAADYLDSLGLYHGQSGRVVLQDQLLVKIRKLLVERTNGSGGNHVSLSLLTDILLSAAQDFRTHGNPLLIDAIRLIRSGLEKGIVRLEPLCEQLNVSRAHLHAAFVQAGMDPPSVFIRNEQIQLVLHLLRETRLPIAEVAQRAGFISMTHFANFMRQYTGKSAREWRMKC